MDRFRFWVRWLLVLPTAVVVGLLVGGIFVPAVTNPTKYGLPADAGTGALLAQSLLVPIAYIWSGTWMAPAAKFRTALVLTLLTVYGLAKSYADVRVVLSPILVEALAANMVGIAVALYLARRSSSRSAVVRSVAA